MTPQLVKTYDYLNEQGKLLFQACRYEPKDFRHRQPRPDISEPRNDKSKDWLYHLHQVRRVLYRLPELLGVDPKRVVILCEGEKSVDRLIDQFGLIATTNPGGAGKWLPEYNEILRGRRVVIIHDYDKVDKHTGLRPGWEHAVKVANALHGIAASVKVLSLPIQEGQDIDDWLDQFQHLDKEIAQLVQNCPEWTPRAQGVAESLFVKKQRQLLEHIRDSKQPLVGFSHAFGELRWLYLQVEKELSRGGAIAKRHELTAALTLLAATCQRVVEELDLPVDQGEPSNGKQDH
jgi:hypothetical protein